MVQKIGLVSGGFQKPEFDDTTPTTDSLVLLQPLAEMKLDLLSSDLGYLHRSEHWPQTLERASVCLVSLLGPNRGLRVVDQEKVCPVPESNPLTLAKGGQGVIVSGLKPLA